MNCVIIVKQKKIESDINSAINYKETCDERLRKRKNLEPQKENAPETKKIQQHNDKKAKDIVKDIKNRNLSKKN